MTVANSIVAAGVAQSALQAQQVARERDSGASQSNVSARRMRDLLESHMRALEEGDEFESPAQLHIDNQLPDQPSPDYPQHQAQHRSDDEPETEDAPAAVPPSAERRATLYRHLDVQA